MQKGHGMAASLGCLVRDNSLATFATPTPEIAQVGVRCGKKTPRASAQRGCEANARVVAGQHVARLRGDAEAALILRPDWGQVCALALLQQTLQNTVISKRAASSERAAGRARSEAARRTRGAGRGARY
jgi:hypothetical protein